MVPCTRRHQAGHHRQEEKRITAYDQYQYFVGEVGISRHEYLYELRFWEMMLIARGYERRKRDMWSAVRWQTFNLMWCSMADIKKAGIMRPSDLLSFPWERDDEDDDGFGGGNMPTAEDVKRMQEEMRRWNEEHGQSDK